MNKSSTSRAQFYRYEKEKLPTIKKPMYFVCFFIGYPNPIWILHRCSWWPGAYLAPGHLVGRCKSGVSQREIKQYLMAVHSAINMLLLCESCHSCHNWVSMVVIKIPCLHGTRIPVGSKAPLMARFMGSTWGPSGTDRTQMDPMLAP